MNAAVDAACDVLVVGSGPAGVSASFPLVEAGLRVVMVDGGETRAIEPPRGEYLDVRRHDDRQWEWMIGRSFEAIASGPGAISPKFRAPTLQYVFRGFEGRNRILSDGFVAVGSLARGGLSNAWGCGVAQFTQAEMSAFPFSADALTPSYEAVARRIGLSGAGNDDMATYFGVDRWAGPAIAADALHTRLLERYAQRKDALRRHAFAFGRARVAVLERTLDANRRECSRAGFCLWGCERGALYSSTFDVAALSQRSNFRYIPSALVDNLERSGALWKAQASSELPHARAVVVAAGTLASTAIVMRSLQDRSERRLLSVPFAGFALWLPAMLGASREAAPGFAQTAFTLDGAGADSICGFTFSTHALPLVEFVRGMPLARRSSTRLLRGMLSSMVVANCFFPGALSDHRVALAHDGTLQVTGGRSPDLEPLMHRTRQRLQECFRRLGAFILPGSFRPGATGADAHYAGTLPMRALPNRGDTDAFGEVAGLPGVFVACGAALPSLPSKSHTLAMMACADRLGRNLAARLSGR